LDAEGGIDALDGMAWQERFAELQEYGGLPTAAYPSVETRSGKTDFARSMQLALRGRDSAEKGHSDTAMADISEAIRLSDNSPILRLQVAYWCDQLADDRYGGDAAMAEDLARLAIAVLEEAAGEFPEESVIGYKLANRYFQISHLLRRLGRLEEAEEAEGRLIALSKGDWKSRLETGKKQVILAMNRRMFGKWHEMEMICHRARPIMQGVLVELRDKTEQRYHAGSCYRHLGQICETMGEIQEALGYYHQAVKIAPAHPWAYGNLADLHLCDSDSEAWDPQKACEYGKKAYERQPGNARFQSCYGRGCFRTGDYQAAVDLLEETASGPQPFLQPHRCGGDRFYLAMAYWRLGQEDKARQWYEKGVEIADDYSNHLELQRLRAEATELLDESKEAAGEP
jgi:tetratricopeptide (TPR) repeat protein